MYFTQTTADRDTGMTASIGSGNHQKHEFALTFSSTSHTNYTNIEYMDANMTPNATPSRRLRKGTVSQTADGHEDEDTDSDRLVDAVDDDELMMEQQKDKEEALKLSQQIMNIAERESEEMKTNMDTLRTIQSDGLELGVNTPEKYVSDCDAIIAAIVSLYNRYLRFYSVNDRFLMEGRLHFDGCLRSKIKKGQPIQMIFIGFPFKYFRFDADDEDEEVFLSKVDMTDLFVLNRLNSFCAKINEIYCYKSHCTIISMAPFIMDLVFNKHHRFDLNPHKNKKTEFARMIMDYYFNLKKTVSDGDKDGNDVFEFLEWLDILSADNESKYNENMTESDTEDDQMDEFGALARYKQLVESFSLQNKMFSSTIMSALSTNDNLKQIFFKLNDWVHALPDWVLFPHQIHHDLDVNAEIEILSEKSMALLKSYLRVLVFVESQFKHSVVFSTLPTNNECSSIIFSSFQSCRLGFTLSLFAHNKEQYDLDKLNYADCYAPNQMVLVIDDDDDALSFLPLEVLNESDFEWRRVRRIGDTVDMHADVDADSEYIVFSLDGSAKFKMMKLSNLNSKMLSQITSRIAKTWKLKECVFEMDEFYCLQMQHTK